MIIKKPSLLLSTCSAFHSLPSSAPTSKTSSSSHCSQQKPCRAARVQDHRAYATIAPDAASQDLPGHHWPAPPKGFTCPTPYQIFALGKDAPYSKQRFYELVKLYHPDRSADDARHNVSHSIKLERYRLIVAAHAILSDPSKRNAYDRWGAGWAGKSDHPSTPGRNGDQPGPFSSWREHTDPNIWANATWEDWERFHARQDPDHPYNHMKQGPRYLQNSYFISLVMLVALMGSGMTFNHASNEGVKFLQARDSVHDRTSKDLRRVRQETGFRAKEERIEWFLRNREATLLGMGIDDIREEKARALLSEQETCTSENLRARSRDE